MNGDEKIVRLPGCPDCQGRGWFLINPFATYPWPAGGWQNHRQCDTCLQAEAHWQATGTLPAALFERLAPEWAAKYEAFRPQELRHAT